MLDQFTHQEKKLLLEQPRHQQPHNSTKQQEHFPKNNEGCTSCACGKKLLELKELQTINTGIITGINRFCSSCLKDTKGLAQIVCIGCREVIAYMVPGKDDTGFVTGGGMTYHIEFCPSCNETYFKDKEIVETNLIEKQIFLNQHK